MKNIILATLLVFSLGVSAQKSEVITDSSRTKKELFNKSLLWIEKTWGSNSDKVTDFRDEDAGIIRVVGGLKAVPKSQEGFDVKGTTVTELTISVEKGRVKLDFQHTTFKWDAGTLWNFGDDNGGTQKAKWKTDVRNEIEGMISGYRSFLK